MNFGWVFPFKITGLRFDGHVIWARTSVSIPARGIDISVFFYVRVVKPS
jgi:hypothetical protein